MFATILPINPQYYVDFMNERTLFDFFFSEKMWDFCMCVRGKRRNYLQIFFL